MEDLNLKAGEYIRNNQERLARDIMGSYIKKTPLPEEKALSFYNGVIFNLSFLAESITFSSNALYGSGIEWAKSLFAKKNIPVKDAAALQQITLDVLKNSLPPGMGDIALSYIEGSLELMHGAAEEIPAAINKGNKLYLESKKYLEYLLDQDKVSANSFIMGLVEEGTSIRDIYVHIFEPVQVELGRLWQKGEIAVAQEHYATAVTQLIMSQLYSYLFKAGQGDNTFVGACASGELHEIGLRMVSDLLELEGWDTYYLGANMPVEGVVDTLTNCEARVLGLSATMTFNLNGIKKIIEAVRSSRECRDVKIIVGGYAFKDDKMLWQKIGADLFAEGAEDAVSAINDITG